MPDLLPTNATAHAKSVTTAVIDAPAYNEQSEQIGLELNVENLLMVLERYGVKHKEIVAAQAILETGNFTSQLCTESHNLFGLRRPSDGSYFTFDCWEESVRAYRDDVQYKYSGGDYYAFLNRIGYAEDRRYTSKVKRIEKRIAPMAGIDEQTN